MNNIDIQQSEQDYFNIERIDIDNVANALSSHMRNKLYFNPSPFRTFKEANISDNFSTKNLRETIFVSCTFKDSDLAGTGLAGSVFNKVTFGEGNYNNTNFHSSDFRDCTFKNCHLLNTSFDKSVFWQTHFHNCNLDNVSMCDCKFINCSFSECTWTVRLENTLFKDSKIKKTLFRNMNFEFATFDNIHLEDLKLPFPTIPYIYGGLTYLANTQDSIRITSQTNKLGISKEEYLKCIEKLESYYIYTQNYFPLSNILISQHKYKRALICIFKGMELSVIIRRFRMLPNYCKLLAYIPNADVHIRQQLYMDLLGCISNANLKEFEQDNLSLYLSQVSSMLLNDSIHNSITVFLDTNIEGNDSNKIAILYKLIDDLFSGICIYSIQLRHNSPITALIHFFADPSNAQLIISTIQTVILGIQTAAVVYSAKLQKEANKKSTEIEPIKSEPEDIKERKERAENIIQENNIIFKNSSITFNGEVHIYKN